MSATWFNLLRFWCSNSCFFFIMFKKGTQKLLKFYPINNWINQDFLKLTSDRVGSTFRPSPYTVNLSRNMMILDYSNRISMISSIGSVTPHIVAQQNKAVLMPYYFGNSRISCSFISVLTLRHLLWHFSISMFQIHIVAILDQLIPDIFRI